MGEIIYHYTSVEVLSKILESKKLRFTEMRSLNDTSEYLYGLQLLKNRIVEFEMSNNIRNPFDTNLLDRFFFPSKLCSVSFSKNRDDYSFWNSHYVPKCGAIAISFVRNEITNGEYIINDCIYGNPYPKMGKNRYLWFKRIFDINDIIHIHKNRELIHMTFQTAHIKSTIFSLENEVRAVLFLPKQPDQLGEFERDGKVIRCCDQPFNLSSINEIIIGPSATQEKTLQQVINILKTHGIKCKLTKSDIPLNL